MKRIAQSGQARFNRRVVRRAQLAAALFAITKLVRVDFVGRFMVAEFVAVLGLLTFNVPQLIRRIPHLRSILLGFGIFLFGLIASDLYNNTPAIDFLRGWASVVFCVISTLFLTAYLLISPRAAVYAYLAAAAVAAIFLAEGNLSMTIVEENSNYFKVRFVPVFLPGVTLAACLLWNNDRLSSAMLLLVAGGVFMIFDARSSGAGLILASMLLLLQIANFRPKLPQIIFATFLLGALAYGGYVYYVNLVLYHGLGGSNAWQLKELQNPYNPLELLLNGRASVVVATVAIQDRPFLGFGSWARDETGEYGRLYGYLKGMYNFEHRLGIIPVHSMVLAAWVWGGILGFIGMSIVGISMLRLFLTSFWANSSLAPALNVYFIASTWAFFFSPIGSIRTQFPFTIALLIAAAYGVVTTCNMTIYPPRRRGYLRLSRAIPRL